MINSGKRRDSEEIAAFSKRFRFAPAIPEGYTVYRRRSHRSPACIIQVASGPLVAGKAEWHVLPNRHLLIVDRGSAVGRHWIRAE